MRTHLRSRAWFALALLLVCTLAAGAAKRPLTHRDYDSWRSITGQKLSDDGRFLAYSVLPQEGDGELVVRNLETGKEFRESIGERPPMLPANPLAELTGGEGPAVRNIVIRFTADNSKVVFSTFPTKAERDAAKKARKKADDPDAPKAAMVILDLATGTSTRIARVKSFKVPETGTGWIAYLKEPEKGADEKKGEAKAEAKSESAVGEKPQITPVAPAAGSTPDGAGSKKKKKDFGSELVLRNLATGAERRFADVTEYELTEDAALLAYAVSSKSEETNGVYAVATVTQVEPQALLKGKGKYVKLAFDEAQKQLAFLADQTAPDAKSKPSTPNFKVYLWQRGAAGAPIPVVAAVNPGVPKELVISEKGDVRFTRDGKRLFFGAGVPPVDKDADEKELPEEDRVNADLWHWKDDNIQPVQKARAELDKTRSYRAVYHIVEKKFVQLADRTMSELTPSEDGLWGLGGDDREYRAIMEYDERFRDSYLVNTLTGERKLLAKRHLGRPQWSPCGKYVVYFNGNDWISITVPGGKTINLTEKLGVKFFDEDHDTPNAPGAAASAEWTSDGKYVLLADYFDVWQVAPDGSSAKNLTDGVGRKQRTQFRVVRMRPRDRDREERPEDRYVDASKPLLLRAENTDTRETGFYTDKIDGSHTPAKLIWAAKNMSYVATARNADVVIITASRFDEAPDLQITNLSFGNPKKVTNLDAQREPFIWGTAETIGFRNADGVPLSATLYKPENFDPKKKYPMIVYIYEKLSQNVHNFVEPRPGHNISIPYYVSNGYLVLQPDIVYTIGQPGQSAMKAVMPAVDAVVARGFVDENAIGMQGHSWGGYQISYIVTQTNRFRAVAAGAPVSNMTSAYDGVRWGSGLPRQFQYERTQSRIGGTLWQYPMRFIENSPVFMADRVRTPIMILHNDMDDAVPWYQGIEYFLALRRLGKETYMFNYNGEPHHIRRRPNQKDYAVRLQQFFDHFLKGAPRPDWMDKGIPYLEREREKDVIRAIYAPEPETKSAEAKAEETKRGN